MLAGNISWPPGKIGETSSRIQTLAQETFVELEGARKNCDVARRGQFTDIKDIKEEMLRRVDVHFENWLNA
jgi:hypothetical protein